jgi:site-specific DNA-cytosine methylase
MEAASVAWHHLGFKPVAFSEIEPFPSAILKHHFTQPNYPYDVPNLGSLTEFNTWPLATGDVDLLVGGTPCQAFSVAGKRGGLNDPRGQLMLSFLDLAAKLQPRYVLWENVPGVLSSGQPKGSDFGCFVQGLVERGYGVAWRVLDAQYVGGARAVPQRRRRVFVVAYRDPVTGLGDWKAAAEILSVAEGLRGYLAKGKQTRKGSSGDAKGGAGADGLLPASATVTAKWAKGADAGLACDGSAANIIPQYWNGQDVVNTLTRKGMDQLMPDKDNFQGVVVPNVIGTLDTDCGGSKLSHQTAVSGHILPTSHWDGSGVHPTLNRGGMGQIGYSNQEVFSQGGAGLVPAMMFKVRGGSPVETGEQGGTPGKAAGKGFLGSEEKAFTIATAPDQWLAQPTAYSFDSLASNSMKSPNPNSGCREVDLAKTLDTSNACPSKNQGGIGIVHPIVAPTVTTCKGSRGGSSQEAIDEITAVHLAQQAIPIDDGRAIEKHQNGLGVGKPGDPSYTLDTTGAQSVAIPYRKSKRASSTTDNETWVEAEASNTLNNFDLGDTRTTHAVVACSDVSPTVSSGAPFSKTGNERVETEAFIVQASELRLRGQITEKDVCPTLTANAKQGDTDPLAVHAISFQPGNLMRKAGSDPSTETFPTLTKDSGDQSPHVATAVYENSRRDALRIYEGTSPTLQSFMGTGGCNVPMVQDQNKPVHFDTYNQAVSDVSMTLSCSASDANHVGTVYQPAMAVRRLTPRECERLQGFPDDWSMIPWKGKPAEECPDGPRYKACGNSMAVNVMRFIGEAIAQYEANRKKD